MNPRMYAPRHRMPVLCRDCFTTVGWAPPTTAGCGGRCPMVLSCAPLKFAWALVFSFAFVFDSGVMRARVVAAGAKRHTMIRDAGQQTRQQRTPDPLGAGMQQRLAHVGELVQGCAETQTQRV